MYSKLILVLIAALTITASAQGAGPNYHLYVSDAFNFSVEYPRSWNRGDVLHPQTVIRVESPDGDDFNITVVPNKALEKIAAKEFSELLYDQVSE